MYAADVFLLTLRFLFFVSSHAVLIGLIVHAGGPFWQIQTIL
jgi:predicted NUDIX family NTP pyrophosphohydrolase